MASILEVIQQWQFSYLLVVDNIHGIIMKFIFILSITHWSSSDIRELQIQSVVHIFLST